MRSTWRAPPAQDRLAGRSPGMAAGTSSAECRHTPDQRQAMACAYSSTTHSHHRCNPVQGATASLASIATTATWNLQLAESKGARVRIPLSPPHLSFVSNHLRGGEMACGQWWSQLVLVSAEKPSESAKNLLIFYRESHRFWNQLSPALRFGDCARVRLGPSRTEPLLVAIPREEPYAAVTPQPAHAVNRAAPIGAAAPASGVFELSTIRPRSVHWPRDITAADLRRDLHLHPNRQGIRAKRGTTRKPSSSSWPRDSNQAKTADIVDSRYGVRRTSGVHLRHHATNRDLRGCSPAAVRPRRGWTA